jgi:magnesium-transporting ATPase (P-type)
MDKKAVLKLNLQEFLSELKTSEAGLTAREAEKRLVEYGPNTLGKKTANGWKVFAKQFRC